MNEAVAEMDAFHVTFVVLFTAVAVVRIYYHIKARIWLGSRTPEGAASFFFRVCVALPAILATVVYLFKPSILSWADAPVPSGARWFGAVLFAAALPFLIAVQRTLGRNFSPELRIRPDHTLVVSGPYRYMRHPMYTASLLIFAGMGLLSANWVIGGAGLVATVIIMWRRTPREEQMLINAFGDRYRRYSESTGRFLPKLRASVASREP
jgi:protein-S-isoprenylcysteine O-methyltransferase Ste14